MEQLKVGDKLCRVEHARYGNNITYHFSTVERLTKTQAILANEVRLINEPHLEGYNDNRIISYKIYGDTWQYWQFETDEIKELARKEKERLTTNKWFDTQRFTDTQKAQIFQLFNPQ